MADEALDRRTIQVEVAKAFVGGQFDTLDEMADRFRVTKERTGSGIWKLSLLYETLGWVDMATAGNDAARIEKLSDQALKWMELRPNSSTAKLAYAIMLRRQALFWRGEGYFNELTDEQLAGFTQYHHRLVAHLAAIRNDVSSDPHWYTLVVDVARQEGWPDDRFYALLDEAARQEPYYYATYEAAIFAETPMWGGSAAKIRAVIEKAAEYTKAVDGKAYLARGYWFADSLRKDFIPGFKMDWNEVAQGFDDLVARYPDQWNINHYAKHACLAGDRPRTVAAFNRVEERLVGEAWQETDGLGITCQVWALHPERNIQVETD